MKSFAYCSGCAKPRITRPGGDAAGQVEEVGGSGSCRGAFAEYACTSESALVTKLNNVTFEQAGTVPGAATHRTAGFSRPGTDSAEVEGLD